MGLAEDFGLSEDILKIARNRRYTSYSVDLREVCERLRGKDFDAQLAINQSTDKAVYVSVSEGEIAFMLWSSGMFEIQMFDASNETNVLALMTVLDIIDGARVREYVYE